jgi:hypothetical protein
MTNVFDGIETGADTTYTPVSGLPYDSTVYLTVVPYNGSSIAVGCPEGPFTVDFCVSPRTYQWDSGIGLWNTWGAWNWDYIPYPCADVLIEPAGNVTLMNGKEGTGATLDVQGELTVELGAVLDIGN